MCEDHRDIRNNNHFISLPVRFSSQGQDLAGQQFTLPLLALCSRLANLGLEKSGQATSAQT